MFFNKGIRYKLFRNKGTLNTPFKRLKALRASAIFYYYHI